MIEYIVLLPKDADTWMFPLVETYYRALTPAMQVDMTQNKFKMPHNHKSDSKKEQAEALNEVRSNAIKSHERKFLNTNVIKEQVEAVYVSSGLSSSTVMHNISVDTSNTTSYENFTTDPTMHTLTDDEINKYSYDGDNRTYGVNEQNLSSTFNYKLQAEQTYTNYSNRQDDADLPPDFVQEYEVKQGTESYVAINYHISSDAKFGMHRTYFSRIAYGK